MGSESATLHIRIDLTGISRRRQVSAAIPRTDTRLAQWSPYAAVWSRLSADMTGWHVAEQVVALLVSYSRWFRRE